MSNDYNSIHLQEYPNVSNLVYEKELVDEMDVVREICSVALFLRDKKKIRVRLPLNEIKIVGKNISNIEKYKDIISDEINVKNVIFEEDINKYADYVIEVNLKKVGEKYGSKLKDIMKEVKQNNYKIISNNKVEITNNILEDDEFSLKLKSKTNSDDIQSLSNNKILIKIDFNITEELELEGLARDLVRIIQQKRKDANLNLSDRINLSIKTSYDKLLKSLDVNKEYIMNQTLSKKLDINSDFVGDFSFNENFNENLIDISFSVIK